MPHVHQGAPGLLGSVLLTITLVFTALAYLRGWVSCRACIPIWRAYGFLVGLLLIWAALASPLSTLDHELLTAHMLKHLLLMTVAPPLLCLGEPVRAWSKGLRRFVRGARGIAFQWLTIIMMIGQALARPEVCWLGAAATLVGWHIPRMFMLAMHSAVWHFVEQSSFLASGLLFWWPVVQPWPSVLKSDLSLIIYLFLATLPCDILSGFLVFCDRVVYPIYLPSSHLFGLSALGDQQCAAALMWTCVIVVYLAAGAILTMRLLSPQHSRYAQLGQPDLQFNAVLRNVQQKLEAL